MNHTRQNLKPATEGENCVMFSSNSTDSLGNAMLNMVQNRSAWIGKRKNISEYCRKKLFSGEYVEYDKPGHRKIAYKKLFKKMKNQTPDNGD